MSEQLSFNLGDARGYLRKMHELGEKRDIINAKMNAVRKDAKDDGVPVKTLEKAIALETARRKEGVPYTELAQICEEAWGVTESRIAVEEAAEELAKSGDVTLTTP